MALSGIQTRDALGLFKSQNMTHSAIERDNWRCKFSILFPFDKNINEL